MTFSPQRCEHPEFNDIQWNQWSAKDLATLCFVTRDQEVLLINKKRGLGAGKINGPGGRREAGESYAECAVREVQEELLIDVRNPQDRGRLRFQFKDGYSLECHIFTSSEFSGTPTETDEAIPRWTPIAALPFDRMWADDELWLSQVLAGHSVEGEFLFDDDVMLGYDIRFEGPSLPKSDKV